MSYILSRLPKLESSQHCMPGHFRDKSHTFSVLFLKNRPPIQWRKLILVLLSITPSPKRNPTSKISPWKNGLELLPYFIIARKACVFRARLLNGHFVFYWLSISFFWCLCLFSVHQNPNTSVSQEPCAVVCYPYFASWNQNKIGGAYNYSGATFEPVWV